MQGREATAWAVALVASVTLVLGAVALEMLSGASANSPLGEWTVIAPLAWPTPARVAWWLLVAVAAGVYRLALHRLGLRPNPLVTVASITPFLLFAGGVAVGADWATWH